MIFWIQVLWFEQLSIWSGPRDGKIIGQLQIGLHIWGGDIRGGGGAKLSFAVRVP